MKHLQNDYFYKNHHKFIFSLANKFNLAERYLKPCDFVWCTKNVTWPRTISPCSQQTVPISKMFSYCYEVSYKKHKTKKFWPYILVSKWIPMSLYYFIANTKATHLQLSDHDTNLTWNDDRFKVSRAALWIVYVKKVFVLKNLQNHLCLDLLNYLTNMKLQPPELLANAVDIYDLILYSHVTY